MNIKRAKYVEDLYLEALAAAISVPKGTTWRDPCLAVAEKIRQLHVSLITEENDKAKMPNMKLDGDASTSVARDHQNDPLRDMTNDEAKLCALHTIDILSDPRCCYSATKAILQKFIESRRHG